MLPFLQKYGGFPIGCLLNYQKLSTARFLGTLRRLESVGGGLERAGPMASLVEGVEASGFAEGGAGGGRDAW